jgi:hypothetical protein
MMIWEKGPAIHRGEKKEKEREGEQRREREKSSESLL